MNDNSRSRFDWVTAALALMVGAGFVLWIVFVVFATGWTKGIRFTEIPFDSETWKSATNLEQRQDMVADLKANHRLIGKTESEVMALLGKPSDVFPKEHFPNSGCDQAWEYRMGPARGFQLMPDVARFVVGFVGGKVVRTWQYAN